VLGIARKSLRGGLVVVGGLNLGGSIDTLHNAVDVVETGRGEGSRRRADALSARKQLFGPDRRHGTKVNVLFYGDAREAVSEKAIAD